MKIKSIATGMLVGPAIAFGVLAGASGTAQAAPATQPAVTAQAPTNHLCGYSYCDDDCDTGCYRGSRRVFGYGWGYRPRVYGYGYGWRHYRPFQHVCGSYCY